MPERETKMNVKMLVDYGSFEKDSVHSVDLTTGSRLIEFGYAEMFEEKASAEFVKVRRRKRRRTR